MLGPISIHEAVHTAPVVRCGTNELITDELEGPDESTEVNDKKGYDVPPAKRPDDFQ